MAIGRRILAAFALSVALLAAFSATAAASCAPPLPLDDALAQSDLVVVGTVTATRSNDRIATVAVEDHWKGDSPNVIEVAGGPDAANAATSVDRTYAVGTQYLFFIFDPAAHGSPGTFGARYEDNNCTDTRPYTSDLDRLRPASARRVVSAPPTQPTLPAPAPPSSGRDTGAYVVVAVLSVVLLAGVIVLIWRRRATRAIA